MTTNKMFIETGLQLNCVASGRQKKGCRQKEDVHIGGASDDVL